VHPDAADSGFAALVYDLLRNFGSGDDHYTVDAARNGSQVGIAVIALEGLAATGC